MAHAQIVAYVPSTKSASGCITWSKSARRNYRRSTIRKRDITETRKNRCCNRPYKWTSDSLFIKAMPAWLQLKLMEQTTATPNDDVCNLLRRQITIRELYWKEDYWDVGFNEIVNMYLKNWSMLCQRSQQLNKHSKTGSWTSIGD